MRLLNVSTQQFELFFDTEIPKYAILSHRWEDGETTFQTFRDGHGRRLPGYDKVFQFCELAKSRNYQWVWVDTCCINQESSAELSEAINAMYKWYAQAGVCFAYLSDVDNLSDFTSSKWFERGWTLQELLAPDQVEFYNKSWRPLGTRRELTRQIVAVTSIDINMLEDTGSSPSAVSRAHQLTRCSIATKMSWVSKRQTSRDEDIAYCMLGLCDVNMPLLYGEGRKKAFHRLQKEIMATSPDESIFGWAQPKAGDHRNNGSVIALSPESFEFSGKIRSIWPQYHEYEHYVDDRKVIASRKPYRITNKGLYMQVHLLSLPPYVTKLYARERCVPINCNLSGDNQTSCPLLLRLIGSENVTMDGKVTYWRRIANPITISMSDWVQMLADPVTGRPRPLRDLPMEKIYICAD